MACNFTSERPTLPPLHSLDLPMPGSSMNLLLPSIHELHEPCGTTANSCLAAPYPVRNRRVSISSSISSRTSSVSPPPSLITTRTTSSPSPPPPSISRPKVRFVRVDSWENADAALLYPPPEAPHVPTRQDIMSGASSQGRPSGPLLLVGRAMEHLRGPDRCIAKGARVHPYRLVRTDALSRRSSTCSMASSASFST